MQILLPPSEGKAEGGEALGWEPEAGVWGTALGAARHHIVAALGACGGGTAAMLGVKGPHLDRAHGANLGLLGAASLPAWQRYTGVVWDHLDPATLPAAARTRILVASGLGGLFAGTDPVPDYRLKAGARLPGLGPGGAPLTVARFWREHLGAAHAAGALALGGRGSVLVDLLAQEQRAMLPDGLARLEVTLRTRGGALGGHAAKAAKGLLARHLLTTPRAGTVAGVHAALASWEHPDFLLEITPVEFGTG